MTHPKDPPPDRPQAPQGPEGPASPGVACGSTDATRQIPARVKPIKLTKAQRAAGHELRRRRLVAELKLFSPEFPQQRRVSEDPAKLISIFCTRRAAKSYTLALAMVWQCLNNPGATCLYLGLTRRSAHDIIWPKILRPLLRRLGVGAVLNKSNLVISFPEVLGHISTITIAGVDATADEMNKLLGQGYRLACIDEASMYSIDLSDLVYGVLKPAMIDGTGSRGRIMLAGTASNFPKGLFFNITSGAKDEATGRLLEGGWSQHVWTAHDNPFAAKDWAEEMADIVANRPLYMETPQYKQWYLNEWHVDQTKLVYRYNIDGRNRFEALPKDLAPVGLPYRELAARGWVFLLGIDLGWEDDNAFCVGAYHESQPILYMLHVYCRNHMIFNEVDNKVNELMAIYPISKITIDGANKQGVESMRARSQNPYEAVDKQDKVTHIEMFNSDCVQGNIKWGPEAVEYRDETMALVWLTDKKDSNKIQLPKKENPTLPNHRCDAGLYMWRMNFAHHFTTPVEKVVVGSRQWYAKQSEQMWEREAEKLMQKEEAALGAWPTMPTDWGSQG